MPNRCYKIVVSHFGLYRHHWRLKCCEKPIFLGEDSAYVFSYHSCSCEKCIQLFMSSPVCLTVRTTSQIPYLTTKINKEQL